MTNKRHRTYSATMTLAITCLMLLGGCTHSDPASMEVFLTDLLRNAAAALLF